MAGKLSKIQKQQMQSTAKMHQFSDGAGETVNNNVEEGMKLFSICFCSIFGKKKLFAEVHPFLLLINIFSGINISKLAGLQNSDSRIINQLSGHGCSFKRMLKIAEKV